jgi:enoyl-[acyl-carrier protein] reductase I
VTDKKPNSISPAAPVPLMQGKRGLIMGVANNRSIAWGIAETLRFHGAGLAFTYQGEGLGKRVIPLAKSVGSDLVFDCDVNDDDSVKAVFDTLAKAWGTFDFIVHAIAYSNKDELKGKYLNTSRENFLMTMNTSCFSFTAVAKYAEPFLNEGGSMLTLSFSGAERVMPNYNVMGVAKAALEASVRYLAADFGSKDIRVNAMSAGPMRTLAGSAIGGARDILRYSQEAAPLTRKLQLHDIGGAALYLLSDLSASVTGEVHHVDSGFSTIGMPHSRD